MKKRKFFVKAVIFDMDGVITDTMPYHFAAWRQIYRKEGFRVTKCEIYLREGQPGPDTIREILSEHGVSYDAAKISHLLKDKEKLFKRIVRRRYVAGSRSFLRDLKKRGFRVALVTGTARHEVERILSKKFLNLFSVSVAGDEVKRGKPYPDPYLKALKELGIRPCDAIVIENAPFGIYSAKRAGLICFAIATSLSGKYLKDADFVFSSYRRLQRHVELVLSDRN